MLAHIILIRSVLQAYSGRCTVQIQWQEERPILYRFSDDDDDDDEGEYELSQNGYHHTGTFSDMEGQILMLFGFSSELEAVPVLCESLCGVIQSLRLFVLSKLPTEQLDSG